MTVDMKKSISKTIRELYLYPYRSKGENVLRGGAWLASWIIGVVVQYAADQRAMGGAYFIFALSLLLEFVPESKTRAIARFAHGAFCVILFIMLLGSLLLIFGDTSIILGESSPDICRFLATSPTWGGWTIFSMILIGVLLVLTEAHKFFYDEDGEQKRIAEAQHETERDRFLVHLNGTPKGGDA